MPTVLESLPQLKRLLQAAHPQLTVMPGSGVSPISIHAIMAQLGPCGLREVHMSGGGWERGHSVWKKPGFGMGPTKEREWDVWTSSYEKIHTVRMVLDTVAL